MLIATDLLEQASNREHFQVKGSYVPKYVNPDTEKESIPTEYCAKIGWPLGTKSF